MASVTKASLEGPARPPRWSRPACRPMRVVCPGRDQLTCRHLGTTADLPPRELVRRLVHGGGLPPGPWAGALVERLRARLAKARARLGRAAVALGCTREAWLGRFQAKIFHPTFAGQCITREGDGEETFLFAVRSMHHSTLVARMNLLERALDRHRPDPPGWEVPGPCPACRTCRGHGLTIRVGTTPHPYMRPDAFRWGDPVPDGVEVCPTCKVYAPSGAGLDPDAWRARVEARQARTKEERRC